MLGHVVGYGGAYDKYGEQEIVAAMEQARQRLMLTPQPTSELERNKQMALMATKILRIPEGERAHIEQIILGSQSTEELNETIEKFRNGREQLEKIRRE
jgi:hypothetical protein